MTYQLLLMLKISANTVEIYHNLEKVAVHPRLMKYKGEKSILSEHIPEASKAYRNTTVQFVIQQSMFIDPVFKDFIEGLLKESPCGNLRRAQGFIREARIAKGKVSPEIFRKIIIKSLTELRAAHTKTKTKIYVNLAQPESADRVAKMNVDGIGLLRAEFIVAHIGIHPKLIIEQGKQAHYINELAKKMIMFTKPFGKRPVVYRATDFRTNEYRHLEGGEKFEPHEENPMIGYRGASRYIRDNEVFAMEIAAIKKVRAAGHTNLHLMIPFVRIPEEIRQIREMLIEHDLKQSKNFKLWMMVEVPSSAIMVEEFIKEGIDGISIGTNDLTMLLLGVDRDNQEIAYIYDERRSVVLWALKRVVDAGRKHGITVSICGQAPSDYPELAQKLVELVKAKQGTYQKLWEIQAGGFH
jgi:pyruvate,water dikinase